MSLPRADAVTPPRLKPRLPVRSPFSPDIYCRPVVLYLFLDNPGFPLKLTCLVKTTNVHVEPFRVTSCLQESGGMEKRNKESAAAFRPGQEVDFCHWQFRLLCPLRFFRSGKNFTEHTMLYEAFRIGF